MIVKMLEALLSMNFIWSWLLVFPVSVGMEWNDAASQAIHSSLELLQGCSTITSVKANLVLDPHFPNSDGDELKLTATLKGNDGTNSNDKGCGRSTYNVVPLYKKCGGFQRITSLLPSLKEEEESHLKDIVRDVSPRGSLDYVFDGGTAIRYPTKKLPNNWFSSGYTISGWIYARTSHGRQYILSWSDGDTPRHQNMGFFLKRKPRTNRISFGFFHTNEELLKNCALRKKWSLASQHTDRWHFVTLSFSGCSVEFFVDGRRLEEISKLSHVHIPERHLQPKFVIGARWAGSASKYDDYFHGKISGLVLLSHEPINQKKLNCLLECKDSLSLSTTVPPSFNAEYSLDGSLVLHGTGDNKLISKMINDIVYVNDNEFPSKYQRRVTIAVENLNKNVALTRDIAISVNRTESSIAISGMCDQGDFTKKNKSQTQTKLCPKVMVEMKGCTQYIDSMLVETDKDLNDGEKLHISPAEISRHGLKQRALDRGFVIYGISTVEKYTRLLQNVRYSLAGDSVPDENFARKISTSLSSHNGLVNSNRFEILVIPLQGKIVSFRKLPFSKTSPNEMGVDISNGEGNEDDELVAFFVGSGISNEAGADVKEGRSFRRRGLNWAVFGCVVLVVSLIPVAFFVGYRKYQRHIMFKFSQSLYDSQLILSAPEASECVWDDEEGLTSCLKINPTERVSICNDPYIDLLSKKKLTLAPPSTTDGSVYSDEEEEEDFDNDSIRQLEWDCLENSLSYVLNGEDRCSSAHSRASELVYEDIIL